MTWIMIIIAVVAYLLIGGLIFFLVSLTDEYNPKKWIPTFVLTVFLWPLIFIVWGVAAMFSKE